MVFGALLAGGIALAPTFMNIGSKSLKFYGKHGNTNFGRAAQFGLGYGAFTAVGYNIVPQFGRKSYTSGGSSSFALPYVRYSNNYYGGRRYTSRYRPRSYRRYAKRYSYRRPSYGRRYY